MIAIAGATALFGVAMSESNGYLEENQEVFDDGQDNNETRLADTTGIFGTHILLSRQ